jgi:hypothetical protein
MSTLTSLLHQRQARAAIGVWVLIPTVFLFFALALAVDPAANVDHVRVGVAVLDEGVETPDGTLSVGARVGEGLAAGLGVETVPYPSEIALREAILARDVSLGIVAPAGMTQALVAGGSAQLQVVRSDANDVFTNNLSNSIAGQLSANLNATLPALLQGQSPTPPLVTVTTDTVAVTTDARFPSMLGTMLLPLWMAGVAFAVLLSEAGNAIRATRGAVRSGLAELAVAAVAAGVVAAVITADVALFTWRSDLDLAGLFGILWLGLLAIAWILVGTVRLFGIAAGAVLGVTALFLQQPISGAAFPASFAPDSVRWLEPVAPLRYLVEGVRNVLIGGSTTPDMAAALALLAAGGFILALGGMARLAFKRGAAVPRKTLAAA